MQREAQFSLHGILEEVVVGILRQVAEALSTVRQGNVPGILSQDGDPAFARFQQTRRLFQEGGLASRILTQNDDKFSLPDPAGDPPPLNKFMASVVDCLPPLKPKTISMPAGAIPIHVQYEPDELSRYPGATTKLLAALSGDETLS